MKVPIEILQNPLLEIISMIDLHSSHESEVKKPMINEDLGRYEEERAFLFLMKIVETTIYLLMSFGLRLLPVVYCYFLGVWV